jgi:hypothetical protein
MVGLQPRSVRLGVWVRVGMEQLPSQKNPWLQPSKGGLLRVRCWPLNTAGQGLLAMQQAGIRRHWLSR